MIGKAAQDIYFKFLLCDCFVQGPLQPTEKYNSEQDTRSLPMWNLDSSTRDQQLTASNYLITVVINAAQEKERML